MTKFVWVIEDGYYSDYHVIGVFSNEKNAKLVQKLVGGDINKWPLNPCITKINNGLTKWQCLMLRNGDTESVEPVKLDQYNLVDKAYIWTRSTVPANRGKNIHDVLSNTVWAKDVKHAIKITNEIRTQMIAEGQWEVTDGKT